MNAVHCAGDLCGHVSYILCFYTVTYIQPTDDTGYNVERAPCPKVSGVIPLCYISRKEMAFWSLAKRKRRFVSWRHVKYGALKIDSWDKLTGFLETSNAHFVPGNHILTLLKSHSSKADVRVFSIYERC
jgi:hypothetical protein